MVFLVATTRHYFMRNGNSGASQAPDRRPRNDPASPLSVSQSINDGLRDGTLEIAMQRRIPSLLNEKDADDLLLRVHPEVRAERAVPPEEGVVLPQSSRDGQ